MKAEERGAGLIPAHLAGGRALKGTRLASLAAPPVADWTRRLRFKCKIRAGWVGRGGDAGGLCSSFNRPKDSGGLALFPNLKIFSGFWELPVAKQEGWAGGGGA